MHYVIEFLVLAAYLYLEFAKLKRETSHDFWFHGILYRASKTSEQNYTSRFTCGIVWLQIKECRFRKVVFFLQDVIFT